MPTPRAYPLLFAALLAVTGAFGSGCSRIAAAEPAMAGGAAPTETFAVGERRLEFSRGPDRPLPVIMWYPKAESGDSGVPGDSGTAGDSGNSRDSGNSGNSGNSGDSGDSGEQVAGGTFPVVLFSHGLGGRPEGFADVTRPLAAAGFVIVAPAYPYTKKDTKAFDRNDVRNQPADAEYILDEVIKLNTRAGDPLQGHLSTSRLCAAGFSAGGFTTSGMFHPERDRRLRCGIVISAGAMDGGFTGQPAPILFVHGDSDKVVIYSRGRTAFDNLLWPKAFLTMYGQGHGDFLGSAGPGFGPALATIRDFLRWNLYGDTAARDRLPAGGTLDRVAGFEARF